MTRLEVATLGCKILALWMCAQVVNIASGILLMLVVGVALRSWADITAILYPFLMGVGQLAVGLLIWFRAGQIARRMVSHEPTPIVGLGFAQEVAMAVAFSAVGVFTLVPALQGLAEVIMTVAAQVHSGGTLWGSPYWWQASVLSSVLGIAASLWLIFGSRGIARIVLWARTRTAARDSDLPGFCVKCGYDLRATPDRCPECGTVPPKPGPPPN